MQRDADDLDVRGVALLMRRGVAVWMRAVGQSGVTAPAHRTTSPTETSCATEGASPLERMLLNIVAAMAMGCAKEVDA